MNRILFLLAGLLIGYIAGYFWKTQNPNSTQWNGLVYVGYPIVAVLLIWLAYLLP